MISFFLKQQTGFYLYPNTTRCLWGWLNSIFNRVDPARIKEVGPDRAAAEWLIRCGAAVKWKDMEKWQTDYNTLPGSGFHRYKVEVIDATDSAVMDIGFPHLRGLEHLRKMKFHRCSYLDNNALFMLAYVKNTLDNLEIVSCGNVSDEGVLSLQALQNLQYLYLYDLPEVRDREKCIHTLTQSLPKCLVDFPPVKKD
ncbi:ATP synthase subunit s, mitochondrial-like isoform X1 [Limulus polyphemus]|uniref:ATP synthase subunit s, mitochondrial-like isoform X1 n=1 Tax=Limulus polyphemus TaxID=6850 RepID=A0ABM1BXB6_LIMPO|nr:ATP synthase subunit s, mitochondrial-like isoform X1 [Limulus polyphemus]